MKKLILFIILISGVAYCSSSSFETPQYGPILVNHADSNDTALTPDTSSWAVCKEWTNIPPWANGLKVQFYGYDPNDPNDDTFSYQFYVADYYGNAQMVCYGNATVGGSKMTVNPIYPAVNLNAGAIDPNYAWVDTVTKTTDWMDGSGVTLQNNGGLNDVSSLIFDRQTAIKMWCRIYARSDSYLEVYCIVYGY